MKPLSGRALLLLFAVYAVACVLLGIFVHPGFYVALIMLAFATSVLREVGLVANRDEWQTAVSHRSSHVAFLVAMGIAAAAFLKSSIVDEGGPPGIVSLVLFIPLLVKVAAWQLTGRGRRRTGLVLGFAIGGFWFLFTAFEMEFSPEFLVGGIPLLASFLALKWQRAGGAILLICAAATGYFFILQGMTPPQAQLFVGLMLPMPLILAGVLLMMRNEDSEPDADAVRKATGGEDSGRGGLTEGVGVANAKASASASASASEGAPV